MDRPLAPAGRICSPLAGGKSDRRVSICATARAGETPASPPARGIAGYLDVGSYYPSNLFLCSLVLTPSPQKISIQLSVRTLSQQSLGRYQIEAKIGRGAMGVVYRARDPKIDRVVAIKTISLVGELTDEKEYRHRFHQEARA